jgi:hypothetical protein
MFVSSLHSIYTSRAYFARAMFALAEYNDPRAWPEDRQFALRRAYACMALAMGEEN